MARVFTRFDGSQVGVQGNPAALGISTQRFESSIEMRRHHEEIAMLPALSLLLPFAGALWLRIKIGRKK